jgi:branched-chain amino acid transport system ATP-binding protein
MNSLRIENLTVNIGQLPIVRNASMVVETGRVCGLVGANGAGKTTLMRGLMGALGTSGGARLGDLDLTALAPHQRVWHGIGYMPGDRQLVPELSVSENILLPAWAMRKTGTRRLEEIYASIPELAAARDRSCMALSGGQQKLVALGRAMMGGSRLLLLDEPFEGLAPVLVQRLSEILIGLKGQGATILITESYESHLAGLADTLNHIERGAILSTDLCLSEQAS